MGARSSKPRPAPRRPRPERLILFDGRHGAGLTTLLHRVGQLAGTEFSDLIPAARGWLDRARGELTNRLSPFREQDEGADDEEWTDGEIEAALAALVGADGAPDAASVRDLADAVRRGETGGAPLPSDALRGLPPRPHVDKAAGSVRLFTAVRPRCRCRHKRERYIKESTGALAEHSRVLVVHVIDAVRLKPDEFDVDNANDINNDGITCLIYGHLAYWFFHSLLTLGSADCDKVDALVLLNKADCVSDERLAKQLSLVHSCAAKWGARNNVRYRIEAVSALHDSDERICELLAL